MILAARQLGWAHSRPLDASGKPGKTILEIAHENGGDVPLPALQCPNLYAWLMQAGIARPVSAGMGVILQSISAQELAAWSQASGCGLLPWEFNAMRAASVAYCAEYGSPGDFPPFGDPEELYDDDVLAQRLEAGLDKLCG